MDTEHKSKRTQRIQSLKMSLSKVPIISKNVSHISAKIDEMNELKKDGNDSLSNAKTNENEVQNFSIEAGLFEEKYQLGKKIGEGANGLVRQCFHKKKNKIYAVKTMMMDQQQILTLKRNFLNIRALHHPNIIQFKALYLDMKKHLSYLVMEYLGYPNLLKFLKQQGDEIHEEEIKWIFYQVFKGIEYLHSKKISHRDIKPENILINSKEKTIKIIDFGSCKNFFRRKQKTDMLTIAGSLNYSAPEMFLGGGYSQKIDLWAVGVSLYQVVTGENPFQSKYHSKSIHNIINHEPDFQHEQFNKYSKFLKDLIQRLLKKNPAERLSAKLAVRNLWFQKPVHDKKLSKSCDTLRREQTEFHKLKPRLKQFNPTILSIKSVIKNVNGADYYRIESDD